MRRPRHARRDDALALFRAALDAVDPARLVREALHVDDRWLVVGDAAIDLTRVGRIAVVGAGKAGGTMAAALEAVLGPRWCAEKRLEGWVNVPADCARPLQRLRLHPARPPARNEPTPQGEAGATQILRLVESLQPGDLCLALWSGGGSALLPLPIEGVSLADKLAITRHLSAAGADIAALNTVRKQLSRVKGGRLAQACRAPLVSLVISDVIGDPLDLIASGPTVEDHSTPDEALAILKRYGAREAGIAPAALDALAARREAPRPKFTARVTNLVIGNLATAVDAAGAEAERRGYAHAMQCATRLEGEADELGQHLARLGILMDAQSGPDCLVSGGEPVVTLGPDYRGGLGGRNQQLALSALVALCRASRLASRPIEVTLLSVGTDGEDGPTDAAGALIDETLLDRLPANDESLDALLARRDAYHVLDPLGALVRTGSTGTNVGDLRVLLVGRRELLQRTGD